MKSAGKPLPPRSTTIAQHLSRPGSPIRLEGKSVGSLAGWFLGPKAENEDLLAKLIATAIHEHAEFRRAFHPKDPVIITADVKRSAEYQAAVHSLDTHAANLFAELKLSAPISSPRHQGHMLWDQALPAIVGYVAAMLYNQNNVAYEVSPVTTHLEIEVGNDLCRMLGYSVPRTEHANSRSSITPWGHITCDGSVANIEALWAARNVKLLPIALQAALHSSPALARAKRLTVRRLDGSSARIADMSPWSLLNLRIDDVLGLIQSIEHQFGIAVSVTNEVLGHYAVQSVGLLDFYRRFMADVPHAPIAFTPCTRHYSWLKAGALLGLGKNQIRSINVDLRARMDVDHLRGELQWCLDAQIPVLAVVAVIGSTEESAVDPLHEILEVRSSFRDKGLDFAIHCDAAWGGYFNAMLRSGDDDVDLTSTGVPTYPMSPHVCAQYRALRRADSITVDPHKAGYVPYPAGALCYRNSALRDVVSLSAPVIDHSTSEPTVGIYGVEGSKPGAAAASVYLAHRVIRPDRTGYGQILGECMWTSKRMYARLVVMNDPRFRIVFLQELPSERHGAGKAAIDAEKDYIRKHFVNCSNKDLTKLLHRDSKAKELFMELGSDQVVLAYSFNFFDASGELNQDLDKMNALNSRIFDLCSVTKKRMSPAELDEIGLILTSSSFDPAVYGSAFVDHYALRLGLPPGSDTPIKFLISTTMNPWTTYTPSGDFLQVIEDSLRDAVHRALDAR